MIYMLMTTLAAGGCATTANVQALRDREWKLSWIEAFPSMPGGVSTPTIRFGSDGGAAGNTGCNSARATYTVEGDGLTIGPMMATKRACLNPEGNELERAYFDAVERTRSYRIVDGKLELLDEAGKVVAVWT